MHGIMDSRPWDCSSIIKHVTPNCNTNKWPQLRSPAPRSGNLDTFFGQILCLNFCCLTTSIFGGKSYFKRERVVSLQPHISAKWSYQSPELKVTSSEDKCV